MKIKVTTSSPPKKKFWSPNLQDIARKSHPHTPTLSPLFHDCHKTLISRIDLVLKLAPFYLKHVLIAQCRSYFLVYRSADNLERAKNQIYTFEA